MKTKTNLSLSVLAMLICAAFIIYSCKKEVVKVIPTLTITTVTDITASSAKSGGNITLDGGAPITARGVCWSLNQNPTTADSKTSNGTSIGSFTSSITGLTPGATYYIKAYAINSVGTAYSSQSTFTTLSVAPVLTTTDISAITATSASSGGNIINDGGAPITSRGVCWSINQNPTVADSITNDGTGVGNFTSAITNLTPGATYYIRAYATNVAGTGYGSQVSLTTLSVVPVLTTTNIKDVTSNSASSGGNITFDGGAAVTARGVCWSTNENPTISDNKTNNGAGTGVFTSSITGLTPGASYYIRAYATNAIGTAYGNQISTTTVAVLPTLTTNTVTAIASTTATSGGNITSDGGAAVTARGVCWSTSQNPTTTDSKTNNGTGIGIFTSSLTDLTPGTTYYIKAYAINSIGTTYGSQATFTTLSATPVLVTTDVSAITSTTANSGGNITSDGGASVTSRGVCWSTSPNPTTADSKTNNGTGKGIFTSSITGLNPGTTYYVRAYARNSIGTSYGNQLTFDTPATIPTIITTAISNIKTTSASSGGNITSDGGASVTARGVCWSLIQNPTITDSITDDGTGSGIFASNLSNLTDGMDYYVRAYATNSVGISYGNTIIFSTPLRSVESDDKPLGLIPLTIEEILSIPTVEDSNPLIDPLLKSSLDVSVELDVPSPGKQTYNSCASWAIGYGMLGYLFRHIEGFDNYNGNDRNFSPYYIWTQLNYDPFLNIPSRNLNTGSSIGKVLKLVSEQGCCKITDMAYSITINSEPSDIAKANAANYKLTDFYRFRVFNLSEFKHYLSQGYPLVFGCKIDDAFKNDGKEQFEEINGKFVWKKYTDDNREGHSMLICGYDDDINAFKVLNSWGSNWGKDGYFWIDYDFLKQATIHLFGPLYYEIFLGIVKRPYISTNNISEVTTNSVRSGGIIIKDWGYDVTDRGICWSKNPDPKISDNKISGGSGTDEFDFTITGLSPNTEYYVKAYAINKEGISYGFQKSFTTTQTLTKPNVSTNTMSAITQTSAIGGGYVISDGGSTVTSRGVCWNTSINPTISNYKTINGSGIGSFVSILTGLSPGTPYYLRAYATNSEGTAYGGQVTFTTGQALSQATVTTSSITSITQTTATGGGNVTSDGGATVTARGVCWSTSSTPTTANSKTTNGTGTGTFTSSLTGLTANTPYYVRAYATNSEGTAYGGQVTFTTWQALSQPTVTTSSITSIAQTTATGGGNVTSDGGATVTARGVCWSTSSSPTTANSKTTNGAGTGSFTSSLTGLTVGTLYYVRAYATNSQGTAYGTALNFTTSSAGSSTGSFTDSRDGKVYKWVIIGTQTWMAENLDVGTIINSSQNSQNNQVIEKYCYNNNPTNCNIYGGLYQWSELMHYNTQEGVQGICPNGWHVPTDAEWGIVLSYLWPSQGGKMKEEGFEHWNSPNTGATNETGFTALGGGYKDQIGGPFVDIKYNGNFWTSTENSNCCAWQIRMHSNGPTADKFDYYKLGGLSVRCIKD